VFEERFGALYAEATGRPALPTRMMVALYLLKHMDRLSDEAVCARYLDSPYLQYFEIPISLRSSQSFLVRRAVGE
jgi:IS5 family transposase